MKKIKHTRWLSIIILFSLFLFSCSQENEIENLNAPTQENFVKLSEVKDIADNLSFPTKNKTLKVKGVASSTRTVESIHEMKNENRKISFYVINYSEGGFVLLSADKRTQPILGFSEENKFTIDEDLYPISLKFWINNAKKQIADIQNSSIVQSEKEKVAWKHVQIQILNSLTKKEPEEACYEHVVIDSNGPLLNSTWYQTGGFNDELPYITCNGNNFQVYAGCVPIAMAQVMKYHQYPTNYNWSAMPFTYATTTTANFIEDIHDAIGNVYSGEPDYYCDGTGVDASADMGSVLKTQFNYTYASRSNYDREVVVNNIRSGRPVILSGDNGTVGHMWVSDGYRRTTYYFDDCTGVGYLHFHMNWGWENELYNGWFSFDNFNPGNTHYNNNNKMIYNITP